MNGGQHPPDLNEVLVFSHVGTTRNLTLSAKELGMSKAAVSDKIRALEERFGLPLLVRKGHGVELTVAGAEYLGICMKMREAWVDAEVRMAAISNEPRGALRVGTTSGLYHEILGPLLRPFCEAFPAISLEVVVENRPLNLGGDASSVAICPWEAAYPDLPNRQIGTVTLALFASREYLERCGTPEVPADLVKHAILRYEVATHTDIPLILTNGKDTVTMPLPRSTFVSSDIIAVREAAARGIGITLTYANGVSFSDSLVPVLPAWKSKRVFPIRVVFGARELTVAARTFVDYLIANVPDLPSMGGKGHSPTDRAIALAPRRRPTHKGMGGGA